MDDSWHKSSKCDNGLCCEIALIDGDVHMRDAAATELALTPDAWRDFVAGVKDGEFDRPH